MKSIYESAMAQTLKDAGFKFQTEVRVCKERKWRFDFVLEPIKTKIAIEVEGGIWTGHGRHSTGKGFISDTEKYNYAQLIGYIVLRYTPETIPNVINDLKFLSEHKHCLLYTSPSPRDGATSRMPSSA